MIHSVDEYERYLPLLLEADPSEQMMERYIHDGDIYICEEESKCICIAVVVRQNGGGCELKNLATAWPYRKQGYAGRMLSYLFDEYTDCGYMLVGTSDGGVAFYQKHGFEYSHRVKDFFTDNYDAELLESDGSCTDMIYLRREL